MLAWCEADWLVAWTRSPADARRQVISLTSAGQAVYTKLDARSSDQIRSLLARLPEAGRQRLTSAMTGIREVLDPTYGCYTRGKLEILDLREQARQQWGAGFTLQRFHAALLALGSPPLGLMGTAIVRG